MWKWIAAHRLRAGLASLAVLAVVAAVTSFLVVRAIDDSGPSVVAQPALPLEAQRPGPSVTPSPGSTPDTNQPWWYVPYENEDRMKPRFDQTVSGIAVGPTVRPSVAACDMATREAPLDAVAATPVDISPAYLPSGSVVVMTSAVLCGDEALAADASYEVPSDPASGRLGGGFSISRVVGEPKAQLTMAADRWMEGEVAGKPAAVAAPILENGLGESAVVVFDAGVLTIVQAHGLRLDDVLKIAEGVLT